MVIMAGLGAAMQAVKWDYWINSFTYGNGIIVDTVLATYLGKYRNLLLITGCINWLP